MGSSLTFNTHEKDVLTIWTRSSFDRPHCRRYGLRTHDHGGAVVLATIVMMVFAAVISSFVERHPTFKMLALGFLLLVGVMLIAEGLHQHVPKGYIYFAMTFAVFIELLNMRMRAKPVTGTLRGRQHKKGKGRHW
jgi:Integral membrane protein TerC family